MATGFVVTRDVGAFSALVKQALWCAMSGRSDTSPLPGMCRMIGAGVRVGIAPESAARRNQSAMGLALIELTES